MDETIDVAIVGCGFAGASTAYHLAMQRRLRVVVFDQEESAGYHASGRNAALGRQLTEHDNTTIDTMMGIDWLHNAPQDFCEHRLIEPVGAFYPFDDDEALQQWRARADYFGIPCETVPSQRVIDKWPELDGSSMCGALHVPTDGIIDVDALLNGYIRAARNRGADIRFGTRIDAVATCDHGHLLTTHDGARIQCRVLVNAAGPWAGTLLGRPQEMIPRKRHLYISAARQGDKPRPFVWHLGADEYYIRDEGDGLLLCACDETVEPPGDALADANALEVLAAKMERAAPKLCDANITHHWAGLRTFTPNRHFRVEWDVRTANLFWVAGLGGHGASASFSVGRRAANRIITRLTMRLAQGTQL